jgi:hypothetical protein
MAPRDPNADVLERALEALEHEAGLRLVVEKRETRAHRYQLDAVLRLDQGRELLAAEVKRWAGHANLGALIHQIKTLPFDGVLVADYINPKMAEKLRREGVQFIDTVGNAYLNQPPVYVFVAGKPRPMGATTVKEGPNRAFDRTGLKVVFAFLCDPALINAPYRDIADMADVALGTVGWVLNGLKATGLVLDKGKRGERRITNYRRMLDRWVEAYPEKLRPKLLVGNFQAEYPYWWKEIDIREFGGYWGGETAAAIYTNYLKPAVATAYLPEGNAGKLLAKARLRKAPDGAKAEPDNVRLYKTFWPEPLGLEDGGAMRGLVPPVLAYADLLATGDPRNREVAGMIYHEYIARHCRED